MIFLLNKEYVVWEVVELARLHMCEVLRVPTIAVEAKLELANEKLSPEFLVDAEMCEGVTTESIKEVVEEVYKECKEEMLVRLHGVTKTRADVLKECRGVTSKEPGEAEVAKANTGQKGQGFIV